MSFRLRVATLAAAAVALAVIGSATLMYAVVERRLVGEVDASLVASALVLLAVLGGLGCWIRQRAVRPTG